MKDRAAGVVIKDKKILVMWRYRNGNEYYVLPGGTMENGESPEQTLKREMFEETNLEVEIGDKLYEYFNEHISPRTDRYFLITKFSGEIKMGAPEIFQVTKENIFRPEWIDIDKLSEINLMPEVIKIQLMEMLGKYS